MQWSRSKLVQGHISDLRTLPWEKLPHSGCLCGVTAMTHPLIDLAPDVRAALAAHVPVVALESTIITHGMPYPQNVATAREVEAVVRKNGAAPATIAVIDGRIRIGLPDDVLDWLGTATDILKLSRADLPYAVRAKRHRPTPPAAANIRYHP